MADLRLPPALYWSPSLGQHLDGIEGTDDRHGLLYDAGWVLYAWIDGEGWSLLPVEQRPADAVQLVRDNPRAPLAGLPTAATMTDDQIIATLRRWLNEAEDQRDTARAEAERLRGDLARSISEVQGWRDTALAVQRRADQMRPVVDAALAYADSIEPTSDTPQEDALLDAVAAYRARTAEDSEAQP